MYISIRIYKESLCCCVGCAGGRTCKHSNTKHAMHTKSAWKHCTARDARILGGLVYSGLDTGKTLKTLEKWGGWISHIAHGVIPIIEMIPKNTRIIHELFTEP